MLPVIRRTNVEQPGRAGKVPFRREGFIRETQAVYVEDLYVAGLGRTRLARSVHDAGWSAFTSMLEYKARKHGRAFARIGRWEPTSQALQGGEHVKASRKVTSLAAR